MPKTRRRTRAKAVTPETLAARLPDELKTLDGLNTTTDYGVRLTAVADWLNDQVPGQADRLVVPVLVAAGSGPADFYAAAFKADAMNHKGIDHAT